VVNALPVPVQLDVDARCFCLVSLPQPVAAEKELRFESFLKPGVEADGHVFCFFVWRWAGRTRRVCSRRDVDSGRLLREGQVQRAED